jgi:hypothetical protein
MAASRIMKVAAPWSNADLDQSPIAANMCKASVTRSSLSPRRYLKGRSRGETAIAAQYVRHHVRSALLARGRWASVCPAGSRDASCRSAPLVSGKNTAAQNAMA